MKCEEETLKINKKTIFIYAKNKYTIQYKKFYSTKFINHGFD